jgi:hypothetical protein
VIHFVPKYVQKCSYPPVPEVGYLNKRELAKKAFDFTDHKIFGVPGIHLCRKYPCGNIPSYTFQVFDAVLYIIRLYGFWKVAVTAAAEKERCNQEQKNG